MKNWKSIILTAAALAVMSIVPATPALSQPTQPGSAKSSPNSATRVETRPSDALNAACMAAAIELEKTRELVSALDVENGAMKERLETEKRISTLFAELADSQKSEAEALRATIAAKNETITAKDSVIAAQDKLVAALKSKRPSLWRRLGDVLIGAAAIAVLK